MSQRRYKTLTQVYAEMHAGPSPTLMFSVPSIGGSTPQTAPQLTQQDDEQDDMIKNQLQSIIQKATALMSNIDTQNLEPWVVSKITLADDYIDSVYDRLLYSDQSNTSCGMPDHSEDGSCGCDL